MANKKLSRIEKRRKLEALFDRGHYVRFNSDAEGRPVINPETESDTDMLIWVAPPSPLQREMAIREAQASRARVMVDARGNEHSDQWLTVHGFIKGLTVDQLIEYLVTLDDNEYFAAARREVLTWDEWEDFNALRDAMRQYEQAGSPVGDPEWESLINRDKEFGKQVGERAAEIRADAVDGYKHMPRGKLEDAALDKRIEQAGTSAFLASYEEYMLFYACRDDESHSDLYFEEPEEIKALPPEVQESLNDELRTFITEVGEAKN